MRSVGGKRVNRFSVIVVVALLLALLPFVAAPADAATEPDFSKSFAPATIGPGSVSTVTFTITNIDPVDPVGDMSFTDTLPAAVTVATPSQAATDCSAHGGVGPTVTAVSGSGTISLADASVGASSSCTVTVDVTATAVGVHTNPAVSLKHNAGDPSVAPAVDLTVSTARPGFSKSFAPSTVAFGGRSTLTFKIDNTANGSAITSMSFTDPLPAGMVVAGPANAATDCGHALIPPTLTAAAGTTSITFSANGIAGFPALGAEETCSINVDVVGGALGSLGNTTGDLTTSAGSAGKAAAVLKVTSAGSLLELSKDFTDDPVAPGGTTTLEFTVTNRSRDDAATSISFSDDLNATLTGLTASLPPTPNPPCGAGSTVGFSAGTLTMIGGSVAPEASCTFSVSLSVPAGSTPGTYPNTAGPVTGLIGGDAVTGNTATADLFVVSFPILTKEFTDDPVGAGNPVTLEFTITNPESTSAMSSISFTDELTNGAGDTVSGTGFLPFPIAVTLPPVPDPPCGVGSSLDLISLGTERQGLLLSGGILTAAGTAGDTCSFSLTLDIPDGFPAGTYTNTTGPITATVNASTVEGAGASDDIVIVDGPTLTKEFIGDPVDPGGTASLEFTLSHPSAAADPGETPAPAITAIAFSDDLEATLTGLVATGLPISECGGTLDSTDGGATIDFTGGSLVAGEECTFGVGLAIPAAAAPGSHTNTTSEVTGTSAGVAVTGDAASDELEISGLTLTKEFIDDPVAPGDSVTLRFTLNNAHPTDAATSIFFIDNFDDTLDGMTANPALPPPCGTLSFTAGNQSMILTSGTVAALDSCTFDISLLVPASADVGTYNNTTSAVSSSFGSSAPATDALVVELPLPPLLTKGFTDDPVVPGGTVTLEFTIANGNDTETLDAIAFIDDLDAVLTGLAATAVPPGEVCGGGSLTWTGQLEFSGGSLAPGASCSFQATVTVPLLASPGTYTNTTTNPTGDVNGSTFKGDPASDDLVVIAQVPPTLAKVFAGPADAGGRVVLTFTLDNPDPSLSAADLAFTDDLDAALPGLIAVTLPSSPCGGTITGSGLLQFSAGTVPADSSCSFDVTLKVPAVGPLGTFQNNTSALTQNGLVVGPAATADLKVVDGTKPRVVITTPANGASYQRNQVVLADFTCTDETGGSGIASCVGDVVDGAAIDTSTFGAKTFTVTGTDGAGNTTIVTHNYTVAETEICDGKLVTINMNTNGGSGIGTAGADTILGTPASDAISALAGDDSICADSADSSVEGGADNDRIFVEKNNAGTTGQVFAGDGPAGAAGDDRIAVRAGSILDGVISGDGQPAGDGGADTILFAGFIDGPILGDDVAGSGGIDFIGVLPAGDAEHVIGDSATGNGARDTITIVGNAAAVQGDGVDGTGGNDLFAITTGATLSVRNALDPVQGWLLGDRSGGNGGNDFMIVRGLVERGIMGDSTGAGGGKDFMRIFPAAVIDGPVIGDGGHVAAAGIGRAPGFGGNDTIVARVAGANKPSISGNVIGDFATTRGGNDNFSLGAAIGGSVVGDDVTGNATFAGNGGNDAIGIGGAGSVAGNLIGDRAGGNGGNDILDVSGTVSGTVYGDIANRDGGNDIIFIRAIGVVGSIIGDRVNRDGGDDIIAINKGAVVNGSITGDGAGGRGGNDRITVSGTVHGFINADSSVLAGGNDRITINPAGVVNGNIFAIKGTNMIVVRGTVNGDIVCSATTTLLILGAGTVTGDTSTC